MVSPSDPRSGGGARRSPWWLRGAAVVAGTGVFSWALAAILNGGRSASPEGAPGDSPSLSARPPRAVAVPPRNEDAGARDAFVQPFDPDDSDPARDRGDGRPAWGQGGVGTAWVHGEWEEWEWEEEEGEPHERGEGERDEDDGWPSRRAARGWAVVPGPSGGALDARSRPS